MSTESHKRYCQTLDLKEDEALIREYCRLHSKEVQDKAMAELAALPHQPAWEALVSNYQKCDPGATSAQK